MVGPTYSRKAHIIAQYADSIGIPAIRYSATDPELSDRNAYPAFYRTVASDATAASSIVELFKRFNWTSGIIIYQNDAFGSGGAEAINHVFSENNLIVSQTIVFDIATVESNYTPLVLQYALDFGVLGPHFAWILRSNISLEFFNQTSYPKLIGMLSIESVAGNVVNASINTSLLIAAYQVGQ
ncbi:unnamed protein product [Rotaria sp. Silwood1]|nr:unnamed protein product [Rotaria sp. Silwood1]